MFRAQGHTLQDTYIIAKNGQRFHTGGVALLFLQRISMHTCGVVFLLGYIDKAMRGVYATKRGETLQLNCTGNVGKTKIDMTWRRSYNSYESNLGNLIHGNNGNFPKLSMIARGENMERRTKRNDGAGSVREKRPGYFEGQIYAHGRMRYCTGHSRGEVEDKLQKLKNPITTATDEKPDTEKTVADWVETWRTVYADDIKDSTQTRYDVDIRLRILPYLGNIRLLDLKPVMIRELYNTAVAEGLSGKSVKNLHGTLHRILQDAVNNEIVSRNAADGVKIPKSAKQAEEMKPLKDGEIPLFLDRIRGTKYEALFYVDLFTGLREGEILGLTWENVDFERKRITIEHQLPKTQRRNKPVTFATVKNGKSRTLSAPDEVFTMLKRVKARQAEEQLKAGKRWKNEKNLVFTDDLGQYLNYSTVYKAFKIIVVQIGKPDMRIHDLRHTYATLSIQNGVDIKTVSETLGHATVAFTLDKYGHVTETMLQQSANKLQQYIMSM